MTPCFHDFGYFEKQLIVRITNQTFFHINKLLNDYENMLQGYECGVVVVDGKIREKLINSVR